MMTPHIVGVGSLISVVVIWTVSNYVIPSLSAQDQTWGSPFVINYVNCLFLLFFFVFSLLPDPLQHYAMAVKNKTGGPDTSIDSLDKNPESACKKKVLGKGAILMIGFPFAVLYFAANYFSVASFTLTYPSSASILSTSSGLFSLIIGRIFRVEDLSVFKFISVLLTLLGVILLQAFEMGQANASNLQPLKGNCFSLVAAFLYGCYSTYLKKIVGEGDDELVSGSLMFAMVGFFTLTVFWPGFLCIHFLSDGGRLDHLPSGKMIGLLVVNALVGTVIPNYAWTAAIMFTSSVLVAVGISFISPLSLIIDWFYNTPLPLYKVASMFLMLVGFIFINLASIKPHLDFIILPRKNSK